MHEPARHAAHRSRLEPRHQLNSDPCRHYVRAGAHSTAAEEQVPDVAWAGVGAEAEAEAEAEEEVVDVEARRERGKRIEIRKR